MATIHGIPGEWARVKGMILGLWPLFLGVFACGFSIAVLLTSPLWGVVLLSVALGYIVWSLQQGMRHVERFFKGARGEEHVSEILKGLSSGYHVFNDFTAGRHHIDHVVVGPGGVFAIETKFWRGVVTVEDEHILLDGRLPDRSPLDQTRREAARVREALAAWGCPTDVTPVLTFASDTFTAHRAEVKGTVIINSNELKTSFSSERVILAPAEVERLVGIMESKQ